MNDRFGDSDTALGHRATSPGSLYGSPSPCRLGLQHDGARPLDFEAIARDAHLLSDADIRLSDKQTPIHERGIRLDWLIDFVKAVERGWQEVLSRRDSQRRASMIYDTVPWPDPLPVSDQQEMTAEFVVEYAVRPLTAESRAPLYSRVPPEHRGQSAALMRILPVNLAMPFAHALPVAPGVDLPPLLQVASHARPAMGACLRIPPHRAVRPIRDSR